MIEKKSAMANLERRKTLYVMIGLFFVLTLCYAGLELFATQDSSPVVFRADDEIIIVDDEVMRTDQTPPEPEQQQQQQAQTEVIIQIVDDNVKVADFVFASIEDDHTEIPDAVVEIAHTVEVVDDTPPVRFAEEMCEFPGGMSALYKLLQETLVYPEFARTNGIQGTVVVEFVVSKTGKVSDVKVIVPLYPDCDKEAIRVVQKLPDWKPAKQMGKPVSIYYNLPIKFVLN